MLSFWINSIATIKAILIYLVSSSNNSSGWTLGTKIGIDQALVLVLYVMDDLSNHLLHC